MAGSTTSLQECEDRRNQLVKEIGRKVNKIDDATLSEHRVRDLNDEINSLVKERRQWEERIKQLGGPDFLQTSTEYMYYGRARELPGVKEILQARTRKKATSTRPPESIKSGYYFGFGLENDDQLLQEETQHARVLRSRGNSDFEPVTVQDISTAEIEQFIMERKKQQLQARYLD